MVKIVNKIKNRWYFAAVVMVPWLLQGCAGNPSTPTVVTPQKTPVEAALQQFLSNGQKGDTRQFAQTPWGENVVVGLGQKYFSASGKHCRRVVLGPVLREQGAWFAACNAMAEPLSARQSTPDITVQADMTQSLPEFDE